jgi:hypothetical protein
MSEEVTKKPEVGSTIINEGQPGGKEATIIPPALSAAATIHPNVTKMWAAFDLVVADPAFYESDPKVKKFLEASKAPDSSVKYWKSSMTNARKELNDEAMEDARAKGVAVVMPTEEAIEARAIEKFKITWKTYGKGKALPTLPLKL